MTENTPVVLIGTRSDGTVGAVGLYEDAGSAQRAIHDGKLPRELVYVVMLPDMNDFVVPKVFDPLDFTASSSR